MTSVPLGLGRLIGRDDEVRRIEDLVTAVHGGAGAVAVLAGPAGIGKTSLLDEALRHAEARGLRVLSASGAELEREYAFGVARQLLFEAATGDALDGAAVHARAPLGLGESPVERVDPSAAMHGLYWLVANVAERGPVVMAVDDAHWADEMSLRFLLYVARRIADLPVLLLLATRTDDGLLGRLGPPASWLWLEPLGESDTGRLIAERGLPDAEHPFVEQCHRATGGNPFLVGRLVAEFRTGSAADAAQLAGLAPESIVRWVVARLRELGDDSERLAVAVAVLGTDVRLADAARLADLDLPAAEDAADALIRAQLLVGKRRYAFAHALIQAAVYSGAGPVRRAAAHRQAALLATEHGLPPEAVAAHLLVAEPGTGPWAVDVLRAAAREAIVRGAPASAVSYLHRAVEEGPPGALDAEVRFELGEAQFHAGQAGATQSMREALEITEDPRKRAFICLTLGTSLFLSGDWPGTRDILRRGLAELPDAEDELAVQMRMSYVTLGRIAEPPRTDKPPEGKTRSECIALVHLAYEAGTDGSRPHEEVAELARRAVEGDELLPDAPRKMWPFGAGSYALTYAGRPDIAIAELGRAIALSQRLGEPLTFRLLSQARGAAHLSRGDLLEAIADLESALTSYEEEYEGGMPWSRTSLALCLIERDDLAGAEELLDMPDEAGSRPAQPSFRRTYLYALGRLQAEQGRLREALDTLLECGRESEAMRFPNPMAGPWRADAALLADRLGDRAQAQALVTEELERARRFGAPRAIGIALRSRGLIEGDVGDLAEAVAVLEHAVCELELARTLVEYGAALRRAGRRSDAREPLRRGLDVATRCGGLAVARRAREELVAAGARPRRSHMTGVEALTPSELRVARLAAQGLTNRQIAQALFVSMSTVSSHLGHIYGKLDVSDRAALPAALEQSS